MSNNVKIPIFFNLHGKKAKVNLCNNTRCAGVALVAFFPLFALDALRPLRSSFTFFPLHALRSGWSHRACCTCLTLNTLWALRPGKMVGVGKFVLVGTLKAHAVAIHIILDFCAVLDILRLVLKALGLTGIIFAVVCVLAGAGTCAAHRPAFGQGGAVFGSFGALCCVFCRFLRGGGQLFAQLQDFNQRQKLVLTLNLPLLHSVFSNKHKNGVRAFYCTSIGQGDFHVEKALPKSSRHLLGEQKQHFAAFRQPQCVVINAFAIRFFHAHF